MKRILILGSIVILGTGLAWAGLDPIPFQPEINKLRARENALFAHFEHISAVMGLEPTPFQPVVNQLNTLGKQIAKNDAKIFGIVDPVYNAVLGVPPEDQVPFFDVLEDLDFLAGAIYERSLDGFEMFTDYPQILAALETVQMNAGDLQQTIQFYLPDLDSDYTVRTYYYFDATLLEVELWLYTEGSCPGMGLPAAAPSFMQILTVNDDGTIPNYAFNSEDAITMVAARGWGDDSHGNPGPTWVTMGCVNVTAAPPTVIPVELVDIPGS